MTDCRKGNGGSRPAEVRNDGARRRVEKRRQQSLQKVSKTKSRQLRREGEERIRPGNARGLVVFGREKGCMGFSKKREGRECMLPKGVGVSAERRGGAEKSSKGRRPEQGIDIVRDGILSRRGLPTVGKTEKKRLREKRGEDSLKRAPRIKSKGTETRPGHKGGKAQRCESSPRPLGEPSVYNFSGEQESFPRGQEGGNYGTKNSSRISRHLSL